MNLIDREIEKFDKEFVDFMVESSHFEEKWQEFKRVYNLPVKVKDFLRSSLQRVIDETKEKCIEALKPISITELEPLQHTKNIRHGSKQYEDLQQCVFELIDQFNKRIQQSKKNIEEVR